MQWMGEAAMASDVKSSLGLDLTEGVLSSSLVDGACLEGHVGEETVLLARRGDAVFAVSGKCTHYGAPLADGIMVGETVRCPWHHACFDLRTGEALGAPAFAPLDRWKVEHRGGRIFVTEKADAAHEFSHHPLVADPPSRIVIVGGGAAGYAAADMLRRCGFKGELTMLSADEAPPCDRPNLSKDYLAGHAPEEWIPLQGPEFYAENRIDLQLGTAVERIGPDARTVITANGQCFPFDRLLLATGAEPVRPSIPGADQQNVLTLRSLADSQALIRCAEDAKSAVVLGAGFIGLEVAAALRTRGIEVHVVAPDARPMERILGPELGDFIRKLHEQHGVHFHLQNRAALIEGAQVMLESGTKLHADFVVAGIGVRPRTGLAEPAGIRVDRGVLVNERLETSVTGIFAAGDIARWPDARTGERIRVEHWVVAQRQGQTAARNMLGFNERFSIPPFFWSRHYDVSIQYVGHASAWDAIEVDGTIEGQDCLVRYLRNGEVTAVASIGRDAETLRYEAAMEKDCEPRHSSTHAMRAQTSPGG
jgi:NADPH-dependent 2,4-dienoyl-CoA reductase/sulfur reductase-like enzyme/nitrite reductase/ring-hydroxylating ferredoxin subunit